MTVVWKMQHDDVLERYAGANACYARFSDHEKTRAIMVGTRKMPGEFKQYFGGIHQGGTKTKNETAPESRHLV